MIYFTTGANGAGKTLLTLKDVRDQQLKENRPVYYHGFEMDPAKAAEFGWQEFDPRKWQDLPDGSICVMDECQNDFPLRRSGSDVPDYINAIAQFRRKRGFDFWLIAPHPSLVDVFVRRLIDKPSWHRHLKRAFGADVVSVLQFSSPDLKCEEPGAGARGEVTMRPYPKEVYTWYRSASLHTGKRKIPFRFWVVVACVVLFPICVYFGVQGVRAIGKPKDAAPGAVVAGPMAAASSPRSLAPPAQEKKPMTRAEYAAQYQPRIEGVLHTAPVYDELAKPSRVPVPTACVDMKSKGCKCYTQDATPYPISQEICLSIVAGGIFIGFDPGQRPGQALQGSQTAPQAAPAVVAASGPARSIEPALPIKTKLLEPPEPGSDVAALVARHRAVSRY